MLEHGPGRLLQGYGGARAFGMLRLIVIRRGVGRFQCHCSALCLPNSGLLARRIFRGASVGSARQPSGVGVKSTRGIGDVTTDAYEGRPATDAPELGEGLRCPTDADLAQVFAGVGGSEGVARASAWCRGPSN